MQIAVSSDFLTVNFFIKYNQQKHHAYVDPGNSEPNKIFSSLVDIDQQHIVEFVFAHPLHMSRCTAPKPANSGIQEVLKVRVRLYSFIIEQASCVLNVLGLSETYKGDRLRQLQIFILLTVLWQHAALHENIATKLIGSVKALQNSRNWRWMPPNDGFVKGAVYSEHTSLVLLNKIKHCE